MRFFYSFYIIASLTISSTKTYAGATGEVLGDTAKGVATGVATKYVAEKAIEKAGAEKFSERVGEFLSNPPGILILSSIGALNSGILYSAAAEQEEESEKNIKKIDQLMGVFKDSWIGFCPNGRSDLKEPECYCYKEDGNQNQDRTRSQICQDLWAKNRFKFSALAGNYAGVSKFVDPVGCVTIQGQFDERCNCKKLLNSKGQNACMKSIPIASNGNALGMGYLNQSGFNNVSNALLAQANGSGNLSNLQDGKLAMAIVKQGDINSGIFRKIANDPNKKNFKVFNNDEEINKYQNAIFTKDVLASAERFFGKSARSMVDSERPEGKLKDLIKQVEQKSNINISGSGKGLLNKSNDKKENFSFNLGSEQNNNSGTVQEFSENKNYKIKNDISKDSEESIFNIISNRYINSGLRRLFEENQ